MTRSLLALLALAACTPDGLEDGADEAPLRPSLSMLRRGVQVDSPPPIPEERFIPGVVVNREDVIYPGDELPPLSPPPPPHTDLSAMRPRDAVAPLDNHASLDWGVSDGNLFDGLAGEDMLSFDDVAQGAIGNCYLVAALSSALYADEDDHLRAGLIRPVLNEEGLPTAFAVRLYDAWGAPQDVLVDAHMRRRSGRPIYARSLDSDRLGEEWGISLVEKAFAQWHGGYEDIGNGGWPGDTLQALTGATATYRPLPRLTDASLTRAVREALDDHRPVVAGTFGEDDGVDYTGTGVYAFHAYSVVGLDTQSSPNTIRLRNPWGSGEPPGNGPDDGIFDLDLATFRKLYQGLTFGGRAEADTVAPAAVTNLEQADAPGDAVALKFTATGDDGHRGLATRYDVRVSASPIRADAFDDAEAVEGVPSPQAPGTTERLTLRHPLLEGPGPVYVALRVEDEVGNRSGLSNVIAIALGEREPPQAAGFFDFETGTDLWAAEGLFHLTSEWYASASHGWWCADPTADGLPANTAVSCTLTSPPIDLTEASAPAVIWEHLLDAHPDPTRDRAWLEVSTASGGYANGATVWTRSGADDAFDLALTDLGAFAGEIVRLSFRFESANTGAQPGIGWVVDDVWVMED